jgi:hypothetical protein
MLTTSAVPARKRRAWFANASWQQYWIETRIVQGRVELHAVHLRWGDRYIAKADDIDTAAAELAMLIRSCAEAREGRRRRRSSWRGWWNDALFLLARIKSRAAVRRERP